VPPTSDFSATAPESRLSNTVATRASGFAGLSPEHLRIGRDTIKREADRIQFQVLAERREILKQQNPGLTDKDLQALLEHDPVYEQLLSKKDHLRQVQAAIDTLLDPPAAVERQTSTRQSGGQSGSGVPQPDDDPHKEGRSPRWSFWSEGLRSNAW